LRLAVCPSDAATADGPEDGTNFHLIYRLDPMTLLISVDFPKNLGETTSSLR
jgi:hypothetical protein